MGVRDKLRNIGDYVRTRWKSTDPDSYHRYRAGRERERKHAEHRRERAERLMSGSVRRQSGGASMKSATRLSAQRRSRARTYRAVTRARPNDQ